MSLQPDGVCSWKGYSENVHTHTAPELPGVLQGKWSKEEDELLRELVTDRGPQWKDFGIILGRLPEGCRDR